MTPFAAFIQAMVEDLPQVVGSAEAGLRVVVTTIDLTLPIESRIGADGTLHASLPRGSMATGFVLPLGRVSARFAVGALPDEREAAP